MHISEFDYDLPDDLIAQAPLPERDSSRMLVVKRMEQTWADAHFSNLTKFLREGDVLVVNNTRVFPARLIGSREASGGDAEILLIRQTEPLIWEALIRPGGRVRSGTIIRFQGSSAFAEVLDDPGSEVRHVRFNASGALKQLLATYGQVPLPPYIKRPTGTTKADIERYQTFFAKERGAVAAPTAGLHFTPDTFDALTSLGVAVVEITLHVGYGTFEPVRSATVAEHTVRAESFEISPGAANTINERRSAGGRVVAVGTTSTRALESAVDQNGVLHNVKSEARLTITPGYNFRITDILLTNFHLPKSSLLLLVAAFAGRELLLNAYRHAVQERYRFYSYGDCMLII